MKLWNRIFFVALIISGPSIAQAQEGTGHFLGDLKLLDVASEFIDSGPFDPGHTEFKLLADYTYVTDAGKEYTVPSGTVVNGTSIPTAVWSVIGGPWSGRYRNAAVIHDFLCEVKAEDSDTVHRIFLESMMNSGVPAWKAKTMYFAVLKGGPQWDRSLGFLPPETTRGDISEEELRQFENKIREKDLSISEIEQMAR